MNIDDESSADDSEVHSDEVGLFAFKEEESDRSVSSESSDSSTSSSREDYTKLSFLRVQAAKKSAPAPMVWELESSESSNKSHEEPSTEEEDVEREHEEEEGEEEQHIDKKSIVKG